MMRSSDGFLLSGGDASFNDRQKQLFSQLQSAEKSFNKDKNFYASDNDRRSPRGESTSPKSPQGRQVKKFQGRESIFKAPNLPTPRNRSRSNIPTVPGYHRHPTKWTKYSLEDSPDVTHKSNAHAALSFLNQLKERNKDKEPKEEEEMEVEEEKGNEQGPSKRNKEADRVMFKKKTKIEQSNVVEREEKPFFRSSKLIMPELVVGEKKKKEAKRKTKREENCDKTFVKLGHLDEEDDGD